MDFLKLVKWNTILTSLVIALLGLIIIANPEAAALSVCSVVGWFLIITGGLVLFSYFYNGRSNPVLIIALIQLVPGLYIVARPQVLVNFVSVLLGLILLVYGIVSLREAMQDRAMGYGHWWLSLAIGVVTTGLAVCTIVNPFATGSAVMLFAGVAMLIHGIGNIAAVIVISSDIKKLM